MKIQTTSINTKSRFKKKNTTHCLLKRIPNHIPGSKNNCFRGGGTIESLHHWLFVGWMHLHDSTKCKKKNHALQALPRNEKICIQFLNLSLTFFRY